LDLVAPAVVLECTPVRGSVSVDFEDQCAPAMRKVDEEAVAHLVDEVARDLGFRPGFATRSASIGRSAPALIIDLTIAARGGSRGSRSQRGVQCAGP